MLIIYFLISILLLLISRVYWLIVDKDNRRCQGDKRQKPVNTMIILGSGGHTTEMISICKALNKNWYTPRTYVIAKTDTTSINRLVEIETGADLQNCNIVQIFRSRKVRQSYFTSIFTTVYSTLNCITVVYRCRPELILCNGPGTCIPICVIAFLLKLFFIHTNCKIVFIESFCRVKSLSISGQILTKLNVDMFVVHWPDQQKFAKNIKYYGKLM